MERVKKVAALEALNWVNKAIMYVPVEEKEMMDKVKKAQEELCLSLKLFEEEEGAETGDWVNDKLGVQYKPGLGRHVIARAPVEVGEELIRETARVSFLHHSHLSMNCLSCLS